MISYNGKQQGYIHSIDTGGMVDGPGIRYIVFLAGCSLRCKYCHNPDTWKPKGGKQVTVSDTIRDIRKYQSYLKFSGGGVTVTGGEPFVQPDFLMELLAACKHYGIHTALDTSGHTNIQAAEKVLDYTDLVLLDIKSINPETYKELTKVPLDKTLDFLKLSERLNVPVWIRFVLVPGHTDNLEDIQKMADFLKPFANIAKVEVLPFHKLGEYKWENLDMPYELADIQPPSKELLDKVKGILEEI